MINILSTKEFKIKFKNQKQTTKHLPMSGTEEATGMGVNTSENKIEASSFRII